MSRKKITTSVGIRPEVYERLEKEHLDHDLSKSYIVEEALRQRYQMRRGEGREQQNA